uniref:Putative secreted protein n=1 Tax=Ixodes ricinus TaxID=34613 RepID=A0A6B0UCQ3_IXORI
MRPVRVAQTRLFALAALSGSTHPVIGRAGSQPYAYPSGDLLFFFSSAQIGVHIHGTRAPAATRFKVAVNRPRSPTSAILVLVFQSKGPSYT